MLLCDRALVPCGWWVCAAALLLVSCSSRGGEPESEPTNEGTDQLPPSGDVSCLDDARVDELGEAGELSKAGDEGELRFVLLGLEPESLVRGENEFSVRVLHGDTTVMGAALQVTATMPDHGHGTRSEPSVRFDERTETYDISELDFFMPGVWRVQLTCPAEVGTSGEAPPILDTAAFHFCVEG